MKSIHVFSEGLRQASKRPRLVLVLYLVPLVGALALSFLAWASLAPALGHSLFAQEVIAGRWFGVWQDFAKSPENHLSLVIGPGLALVFFATIILQVLLSAGVITSLFGDRAARGGDFFSGIRHFAWPFFRSFLWFFIGFALAAVACGVVMQRLFKLAENQADARWDVVGVLVGSLLFALLYVPLRGAYELSRMAVVRHGDRKTLRGFFRALGSVLRHPLLFFPLYAAFFVTVLALHGVFGLVRSEFTVSTWLGIFAVALTHQLVMAVRAFLQLGFLAANKEAYLALGEVRYCQPKTQPLQAVAEPSPVEDVFA